MRPAVFRYAAFRIGKSDGLTGTQHRPYGGRRLPRQEALEKGAPGTRMTQLLGRIHPSRRDDGQGLAEYALILALIAIIAIIALIFLGNQVSTILSTVGSSV